MWAGVLLAAGSFATPASAVSFTLSDAFGTGNFGTVIVSPVDATTVHVNINMAPSFAVDTGGHNVLTLSLVGSGQIVESSLNLVAGVDVFTVRPHLAVATYSNSPFGLFTDAIAGDCGSGASALGCGSTISFDIANFQGFAPATQLYDPPGSAVPVSIYAAVDIFQPQPFCNGGCTGVVGLSSPPQVETRSSVPGPIAGAGIPGLVALFGMFGLNFWRRRRQVV